MNLDQFKGDQSHTKLKPGPGICSALGCLWVGQWCHLEKAQGPLLECFC